MTGPPPIADVDLLDHTRDHLRASLQLSPDATVPGEGLVRVFARLAGIVAERINAAADKNFLAFLELTGVQQTPPQAARAPLTFTLAPGAPADAPVSAGSMAAVPAGAASPEPILFETERDLLVTRARLVSAIAIDPALDQLADLMPALGGQAPEGADPFSGTVPLVHHLLVGSADVLGLDAKQAIELSFLAATTPNWLRALQWSWWDGSNWQALNPPGPPSGGQIVFTGVPEIPLTTIAGVRSRWLAATLATPLPAADVSRDQRTGVATVGGKAPPDNAYADATALDLTQAYAPFGITGSASAFALRADAAFGKPGAPVTIRIDLDPDQPPRAPNGFGLAWEYWTGSAWTALSITSEPDTAGLDPGSMLGSGTVSFTAAADWTATSWPDASGVHGYWLRIRVVGPSFTAVPVLTGLTVGFTWTLPRITGVVVTSAFGSAFSSAHGLRPELAVVNDAPVDASRDFLAFGPTPAPGAALYLACDDAIDPSRTTVTATIALTPAAPPAGGAQPAPAPTPSAQLAWEYWDTAQRAWTALTVTDQTKNFTAGGNVTFTPPSTLGAVAVTGQTRNWVRVRLLSGDYGQEATYVPGGSNGFVFKPATLAPPSIASVLFTYEGLHTDQAPDLLVLEEWSSSAGVQPFSAGAPVVAGDGTFEPFTPMPDSQPTLMLGFSEPFANAGIDLYFEAAPSSASAPEQATALSQLVWEYNDGASWRALNARDETGALSGTGLVSFIGPADLDMAQVYGSSAAWLRARLVGSPAPGRAELLALRTNTMWASQRQSVDREVLGSGTAQPNQHYVTTQRPVLEGQILEVLEPEAPTAEELTMLGAGAITPALDAAGRQVGVWVRWIEVVDFIASGPRDRHYAIDRLHGAVTFGDGQRGLVPPAVQSNLRLTYAAGGGQAGNQPAGSITQLRTAIPFISGVTNHEPAGGGADAEDLILVRARGPRTLRHRGRAVAAADFEDLALESSTEVARAMAVPATGHPNAGTVGVVVVPALPSPQPTPDGQLLARVHDYLLERMSPTAQLWVSGPGWLQVTVAAGLVPVQVERATDVQGAALAALAAFLDPLTGGVTGTGWPFGREPHAGDLTALLESVPGLDHVAWLTVQSDMTAAAPAMGAFLVTSGAHELTMLTPGAST